MKKIIAAGLVFCISAMPLFAETKNVDYKRSDGTVTRVTYQDTGYGTTVSSKRYSASEYEDQKKKDAVVAILAALLKWIFTPSKR